jgi:hypothetical protein
MNSVKQFVLTGLFVLGITITGRAQIGEINYDNRIKTKLDALGIKYSITEQGAFKVIFEMGKNRTQLVVIKSNTHEYGGMEIREISSVAAGCQIRSEFSQENLFYLLEKNETYKLGAWQIHGGSAPFLLEYSLRISANAAQSVLDDLIRLAAKVADDMEQALTDEDKY